MVEYGRSSRHSDDFAPLRLGTGKQLLQSGDTGDAGVVSDDQSSVIHIITAHPFAPKTTAVDMTICCRCRDFKMSDDYACGYPVQCSQLCFIYPTSRLDRGTRMCEPPHQLTHPRRSATLERQRRPKQVAYHRQCCSVGSGTGTPGDGDKLVDKASTQVTYSPDASMHGVSRGS